jgi:DNA-binding GntR family transcriptional regulator
MFPIGLSSKKIIKNEIRPGDSILEPELAEMLNISRTPVRQAFGRLVAEGLLEKKRKKGCIIPFPTPENAQKIFQAREIMETEMARQAALNATTSDIDYLKGVLNTETKARSSVLTVSTNPKMNSYWKMITPLIQM